MGVHVQDNGMSLSDWHKLNEGNESETDTEGKVVKKMQEKIDRLEGTVQDLILMSME